MVNNGLPKIFRTVVSKASVPEITFIWCLFKCNMIKQYKIYYIYKICQCNIIIIQYRRIIQ